jgi:hypothetical protein
MPSVVLFKKPIYLDLDRRRRVVFNLNTEILIRNGGGKESSLWETIAETKDPETGEVRRTLDVNVENLRLYLWAALNAAAEHSGDVLALDEVGALLSHRSQVTSAVVAITEALRQYYGDPPQGEPEAPAASA